MSRDVVYLIGVVVGVIIATMIIIGIKANNTIMVGLGIGFVIAIVLAGLVFYVLIFLKRAAQGDCQSKLAIEIRKTALEDEGLDALIYLQQISMAYKETLEPEDIAVLGKLKYNKKILEDINGDALLAGKIRSNIVKIHDIFQKRGFPTTWKGLAKFYVCSPIEFTQGIDELSAIIGFDKGEGLDFIYQISRRMIQ